MVVLGDERQKHLPSNRPKELFAVERICMGAFWLETVW